MKAANEIVTQKRKDNSGRLFDFLLESEELKNDAALARRMGVQPPEISKIRHGVHAVSARMILIAHETFGTPVAEIRRLIGAVDVGFAQ